MRKPTIAGASRKLLLVLPVAGIGAAAILSSCSSDTGPTRSAGALDSPPKANPLQAVRSLASLDPAMARLVGGTPEAVLRQQGPRLVTQPGATARKFDLEADLASDSAGPWTIRRAGDRGFGMTLQPVVAQSSLPEMQPDGRAIWSQAYPGTDLVLSADHQRLNALLYLREEASPGLFVWKVNLEEGLVRAAAQDDGRVVLLDKAGNVRFWVNQVRIVDGSGQPTTTSVVFTDDGYMTLRVDSLMLKYPAVALVTLEAPPNEVPLAGPTPPTVIKGRVLIQMDTSGSMVWDFAGHATPKGDGDSTALFCDNNLAGNTFHCDDNKACTVANGAAARFPVADLTNPSRLYAAKSALNQVLKSQSGVIDFGLERFIENANCPSSSSKSLYCCTTQSGHTTQGRCVQQGDYATVPYNTYTAANLTFAGDSAPYTGCTVADSTGYGGRILVMPASGSGIQMLPWIDYTEDFCSSTSGNGGAPRNPELRAAGNTPLARAIDTARDSWYKPIYNVSKVGLSSYNPSSPLFDPQLDCRTYALVVMSDGANNCSGDPGTETVTLTAVNTTNPVKTYALGMANTSSDLTDIATAGLTVAPRYANNEDDIKAAFADIVASSVKYETCNGKDDNCNTFIDEGMGVFQECTIGTDCPSGTCNAGRCTCTSNTQCASGFVCAQGTPRLCRPSCTVGVGACQTTGVHTCDGCCVDNGSATCTTLTPGSPTTEICDGIDNDCNGIIDDVSGGCQGCVSSPEVCNGKDDDCDGIIDNHLTDTNKACGSNIGICKPGTTACVATTGTFPNKTDHLICQGGTQPGTEVCNGLDDNCDGVVDGMTQSCYDGPSGTANVGICLPGQQVCTAALGSGVAAWGTCVGEVLPTTEVCNGLDDNCNGIIDDVAGAGTDCCPWGGCGKGICVAGKLQCSGGSLQCIGGQGPTTEICDGLDNNCDGIIDNVSGVGDACCPSGNCGVGICKAGVGQCQGGAVVCVGSVGPTTEVCNNLDDDCNGKVDDVAGAGASCCPPGVNCGVGTCKSGTMQCGTNGLQCTGAVGPSQEVCDGLDNDCNGLVDDVPGSGVTCCPGGNCGVGICKNGIMKCDNGALACVGSVGPQPEICDGIDNDCNGVVDDVPNAGNSCCPYKDANGNDLCGKGICTAGTLQCKTGSTTLQCVGAVGPQYEVCNGLDDDCNGLIDDLPGGQVGGSCCPSGKCDVGICKAGVLKCGTNGIYCDGAVNPSPEVCNGLDDDCNGVIDDVPGLGTTCCPSGKCGTGICTAGTLQCTQAGLTCVGAVDAQPEVCDGVDNNCNGIIDDVPGVGTACCPDGSPAPDGCNKGICEPGTMQCQGDALACVGGKLPQPELCNGIDDDCNGIIDDPGSVAANDPAVGKACDAPTPPNDKPPCKAGETVCKAGQVVCEGAVAPGTEVCNGIDDNCNGLIDEGDLCAAGQKCIDGQCVNPCGGGEFACPGGYTCVDGYCIGNTSPDGGTGGTGGSGTGGTAGAAGAAGTGGSGTGGTAGTAGAAGTGGSGTGGAGGSVDGGKGGSGQGGTGGSGTGGTGAQPGVGGTSGTSGSAEPPRNWGLSTGGGGCSCRTAGVDRSVGLRWLAALGLLGIAILRQRRGAR